MFQMIRKQKTLANFELFRYEALGRIGVKSSEFI